MAIEIVCADVLEWCKTYDGPPFHAVLMDPPYHLTPGVTNPTQAGWVDSSNRGQSASPFHASRHAANGFMGCSWDGGDIAFRPETWAALAEHLLPGAFCMAFASTRGYHRMACAIEDAGFRIFPMLVWITGSSFPKASRIDTQVDKAVGAEQQHTGQYKRASIQRNGEGANWAKGAFGSHPEETKRVAITAPTTPLASAWAGHRYGGQVLKDAACPICVFQKPYEGKPVDSITKYGSGALWIERARVGTDAICAHGGGINVEGRKYGNGLGIPAIEVGSNLHAGRWPANLVLQHLDTCRRVGTKKVQRLSGDVHGNEPSPSTDGIYHEYKRAAHSGFANSDGLETVEEWECSESCPIRRLDAQAGERRTPSYRRANRASNRGDILSWIGSGIDKSNSGYHDVGGVSRFFTCIDWSLEVQEQIDVANPMFYCSKSSRKERDAGLEEHCVHPTLKPLKLDKFLATLLLPPAAYAPRRLLNVFAGTGSEAIGAYMAGWEDIVAIEMDASYVEIAKERIKYWTQQPGLLR